MRKILSARVPNHEHLIQGFPADAVDFDVARRACRVAWGWRNEWSVQSASRRIADSGRISKADADRKLRDLLRQQMLGRD